MSHKKNIDSPLTTSPIKVNCPTCKKSVAWNEQSSFRPFCSKRCQQIDFGEWATESFSIPGSPADPELALNTAEEDQVQH